LIKQQNEFKVFSKSIYIPVNNFNYHPCQRA